MRPLQTCGEIGLLHRDFPRLNGRNGRYQHSTSDPTYESRIKAVLFKDLTSGHQESVSAAARVLNAFFVLPSVLLAVFLAAR